MSRFSLASDSFGPEEIAAATEVLQSGRYTMGAKVKEYETAFAKWTGAKHSIMVNSGSSANLLLVDTLIRRTDPNTAPLIAGDEVLVPALAWPTTVWPLIQLGLVPVFVDSDPDTLAIDLESASKAVSSKTKGLFLIHVLGRAANLTKIQEFCRANKITLIEDCCETLGAYHQGKHIGLSGIGGTFSHFFSHHLTTIEGGMIITDSDALADDLRSLRAHGWLRDRSDKESWLKKYPELDERFFFVSPGYNVRPMEMQAAIGLVQIKKLDQFIIDRRKVAEAVYELVNKKIPWLTMVGANTLHSPNEKEHSWMNIPFMLAEDAPTNVSAVNQILEKHSVETRPIIAGNLTKHPAMNNISFKTPVPLDQCDSILGRGFMVGCHPDNLQSDAMKCMSNAIKELSQL